MSAADRWRQATSDAEPGLSQRGPRRERPPLPDPLPIAVVDNHTHLDLTRDGEAVDDLPELLAAAARAGVPRAVQIGCDLPGARFTARVVQEYPALLGGVAIHPNEAPKLAAIGQSDAARAEIEELAVGDRIRVIGETGLDYFRTGPEGLAAQRDSFAWHIDLAKRLSLPLQIHDRDAHADVLDVLDAEGAPERTVLHCFSGDIGFARECIRRGYLLSYSGTVTFKNAKGLRDALAVTPLDQLLVETDAPYLTPTPYRGAPNASYLVPVTVRAMAGVLGVAVLTLCEAIAATSTAVYGPW